MAYNMPSPGGQQSNPYYSDPQWQDYMKLQDLTGQEQQIAQQQALAKSLREGGNQRMDWASQAGRGLSGIGSMMGNLAAMKGQAGLTDARKEMIAAMMRRGGQQPPNVQPQQLSPEDLTGF